MGYGLRNLTDIPQGLGELRRVLKPGATAAILDFHQPQNPLIQQFQQWYFRSCCSSRRQRFRPDPGICLHCPQFGALPQRARAGYLSQTGRV